MRRTQYRRKLARQPRIGLASHWPRVRDAVHLRAQWSTCQEDEHTALAVLGDMSHLTCLPFAGSSAATPRHGCGVLWCPPAAPAVTATAADAATRAVCREKTRSPGVRTAASVVVIRVVRRRYRRRCCRCAGSRGRRAYGLASATRRRRY